MSRPQEQMVDVGRGVSLCCERWGEPGAAPLVLIAGLGQQLLSWPPELCELLVERGYQVLRFDNRDIGLSWHAPVRPPTRRQLITGRFNPDQYDLGDMAADAAGLIDALGLRPTHVVGVSMGGMIGQTLAAEHPEHVRSLTSIMSTTGARRVGWIAPSALRLVMRPPARSREEAADRATVLFRHIGSHGFPFDEAAVRERSMAAFDRDPQAAAGTGRQMAAIRKSGDRTAKLAAINAPTLVIHGDRDRMVHPSGGRATAAAIPGARLESIAGLGHDLPQPLWERLADLIHEHARAADQAGAGRQPAAAP